MVYSCRPWVRAYEAAIAGNGAAAGGRGDGGGLALGFEQQVAKLVFDLGCHMIVNGSGGSGRAWGGTVILSEHDSNASKTSARIPKH